MVAVGSDGEGDDERKGGEEGRAAAGAEGAGGMKAALCQQPPMLRVLSMAAQTGCVQLAAAK